MIMNRTTYRTYRPRPITSVYISKVRFSMSRFLLVFILSLCVISTILILMTQNCKKIWRIYKHRRYKHFDEYNYNEDGTTIDGVQLSSNVRIDENSESSIAFRRDFDSVQFSPDYHVPKRGILARLGSYVKREKASHNTDASERQAVYLDSESDRMPESIYRKYDKNDYKDDFFVDGANNIRPNPFIVHLM